MNPSTRRSFVAAANEFKKIRSEALASYPAAKRGRDRLVLLAYLHALASEFRCTLEALRELKLGEPPRPTPPWLTPDAAMAQVRERRRQLLDVEQTAAGASADDEATARQRARLEHKPGCELVDACQDMAWFQDLYLLAETFAEAAAAAALPVEEHEEFIDEAARAKMTEARQNRTLARMKDFAAGGDGDLTEIQRTTKAVERARKDIDGLLADSTAEYKTTAEAGVRILAQNYPWVFANDQEPGRILASAGDLDDPENRQRMKQWLTTKIVLNNAEAWGQEIRQSLFGDEVAESSPSKADSSVCPATRGDGGAAVEPLVKRNMPKRNPSKTTQIPGQEADPRFVPVAKAFARSPGFSLMESKSGATRGLMLNGKSFGMSTHGRFVLKLTPERAAALIAEGVGKPFSPSPGRVMKGWIEVTSSTADWKALAQEAHRLAVTQGIPTSKKSKRRVAP